MALKNQSRLLLAHSCCQSKSPGVKKAEATASLEVTPISRANCLYSFMLMLDFKSCIRSLRLPNSLPRVAIAPKSVKEESVAIDKVVKTVHTVATLLKVLYPCLISVPVLPNCPSKVFSSSFFRFSLFVARCWACSAGAFAPKGGYCSSRIVLT